MRGATTGSWGMEVAATGVTTKELRLAARSAMEGRRTGVAIMGGAEIRDSTMGGSTVEEGTTRCLATTGIPAVGGPTRSPSTGRAADTVLMSSSPAHTFGTAYTLAIFLFFPRPTCLIFFPPTACFIFLLVPPCLLLPLPSTSTSLLTTLGSSKTTSASHSPISLILSSLSFPFQPLSFSSLSLFSLSSSTEQI